MHFIQVALGSHDGLNHIYWWVWLDYAAQQNYWMMHDQNAIENRRFLHERLWCQKNH